MKFPNDTHPFLHKPALVVVTSSEEGIMYHIKDQEMHKIDLLEEHLSPYSDDEGFFFGGIGSSGGAPKESDNVKDENIKRLRNKIAHELEQIIAKESVETLYIFEPEYLKGRIEAEMQTHDSVQTYVVKYGNYTQESEKDIFAMVNEFVKEQSL